MLASSSPRESSFESPQWEHGAFTYALLRSLGNKNNEETDGIPFDALVVSVRREVRALLRAAQRNETEQDPCVPWAGRQLGAVVARARP
jgi:hypothetical protein